MTTFLPLRCSSKLSRRWSISKKDGISISNYIHRDRDSAENLINRSAGTFFSSRYLDISIRLEKFSACPRIIGKGERPRSRFFGIRLGERRRFVFAFLKKRVAISRRIVEERRRRRRRREHSNGLKGNNRGRSGKQESRERGEGGEERVEPSRRRVTQPHPSKDPWWIDRHTTLC